MGSFSWTRAEATTKRSNLALGDKYKILVPEEFGGGYIKDIYFDYGLVFYYRNEYCMYIDGQGNKFSYKCFPNQKFDFYGILAYWNKCPDMKYIEKYPETMIEILDNGNTHEQENRCRGIEIGCHYEDINKLKYPLKLVSASYRRTYEECNGRSYGDPSQGFCRARWRSPYYTKYLKAVSNNLRLCPECGDAWLYNSCGDYYSGYESDGYKIHCNCGLAWKLTSWSKNMEDAIEQWNKKVEEYYERGINNE